MIFDLMATNGGGIKYFTKDGAIYTDLILKHSRPTTNSTQLTIEDGRLKWRHYHTEYGHILEAVFGVQNINLASYQKIFVTIPEYAGFYEGEDYNGISNGEYLDIYVYKQSATPPPSSSAVPLIKKRIHPRDKYFEINVANINEVCQIYLIDSAGYKDEHVLYISEFGIK